MRPQPRPGNELPSEDTFAHVPKVHDLLRAQRRLASVDGASRRVEGGRACARYVIEDFTQ